MLLNALEHRLPGKTRLWLKQIEINKNCFIEIITRYFLTFGSSDASPCLSAHPSKYLLYNTDISMSAHFGTIIH